MRALISSLYIRCIVNIGFMICILVSGSSAQEGPPQDFLLNSKPKGSIGLSSIENGNATDSVVSFLELAQKILLQVVLPVVAVGTALYVAYELFTADGDESKMKKAWTAVVYSIIGMIAILLSAFVVDLIAGINIK